MTGLGDSRFVGRLPSKDTRPRRQSHVRLFLRVRIPLAIHLTLGIDSAFTYESFKERTLLESAIHQRALDEKDKHAADQ